MDVAESSEINKEEYGKMFDFIVNFITFNNEYYFNNIKRRKYSG